ncbi:MAG: hypothetical protein WCG74_01615 [Sediminibacterium sp.]
MTNNQFDKFFRDQLKDHTAPVPEGLWEKIMPKDKKRPTAFYLPKNLGLGILIATLIIAGLYGGFKYEQTTNNNLVKTTNSIDNNSKSVAQNSKNATQENIGAENTADITTVKIEKTVAFSASKTNNENNLVNNNTTRSLLLKNQTTNKIVLISEQLVNKQNVNNANTVAGKISANRIENKSADESNKLAEENYVAFTKINPSFSILLNTTELNNSFSLVNKTLFYNAHDKKIQGIIICPNIKGRSSFNTDWGIELYASPDYALKYVSNISAPQQYLDKKDSSEQMQISYTAGFRLIKPLNDNFLLKAGFQYSQLNQKFSYRNENEIKTTTVITARTIIRSAGDTILVSDTSVLRQIGYSVNTVHNQFRSIDIPVTLGYQFGNDDLKFGINAGVVFNLSSWYQGEILDTTYASVPMNKVSNALYKTNIGMGLYTSMSLIKRINDNTHLFFEPYFRYNLSNMTNSASPYNQRFHIGGLSVGLRFDLNR